MFLNLSLCPSLLVYSSDSTHVAMNPEFIERQHVEIWISRCGHHNHADFQNGYGTSLILMALSLI